MDGREVFNFTMRTVPKQMKECLKINELEAEDIDAFLLHQASKYIITNMSKRLGVDPEKVPFGLPEVGNCVSSTIPLMLDRTLDQKHNTILISGFGVGLSWATNILKRVR